MKALFEIIENLSTLAFVNFMPFHLFQVELNWLYAFAAFVTLAHVHFGVCVVREIASYLKVSVFSIKKAKS